MSLLSEFMRKPYPGLSQSLSALTFTAATPDVAFAGTDTTIAGRFYPALRLRNAYQAADSGGQVLFECKNASAGVVTAAALRGTLDVLTAGAENGLLALSVLKGGSQRYVYVSAVDAAITPSVDGDFALGKNTARFAGLYVGNAAATYKGNIEADVANTGFAFGSANAVATLIKANGVVVARVVNVGASGAFGFGAAANPDGNQQVRVTGSHPGPGNIVAGVQYDGTILSTATTIAASFRSAPATVNASFVLGELAHFYAGFATRGAANTITVETGLHVGVLTSGTTIYGIKVDLPAAAANYAVYAGGGAQSFFAGNVGIGVVASATAILSVQPVLDNATVAQLNAPSSSFAGTLLLLKAGANSAVGVYDAISLRDPSNLTMYQLRGSDGALMMAPAGITAAQLNSALLSMKGRLAQTIDATYNLATNTRAVTHVIDGSAAIGNNQQSEIISLRPSLTLSGNGNALGVVSSLTLVAATSSNSATAVYGEVASGAAGLTRGIVGVATATVGHTGTLMGAQVYTAAQGTTAVAYSIYVSHVGKVNYAMFVQASAAGDQCDTGLHFDNATLFNLDVIRYKRRASGAANFLRLTDESAVDRFIVDKDGNIISAGLTVFANADVALGPTGATTTMVTGFPYMPFVGGTPTGVPTGRSGHVPFLYDTAANKIWVYNGAWKSTAALT